jgi:hypothetical protein
MKNSNFVAVCLGLLTCSFLVGCNHLLRSSDSGYADGNPKPSNFRKTSKVSEQRIGDRGAENISQKTHLKKMENSLSNKKEIEQYSKALPWFRNDEERLEFLSTQGFEERQRWMNEKAFNSRAGSLKADMQDLVEAQDIALGMPQNLVRQSWGDPDAVEVSGNPVFKNERWRYSKFVSTQDGYKPEKKTVYFEGGKVVGWELE